MSEVEVGLDVVLSGEDREAVPVIDVDTSEGRYLEAKAVKTLA